MPQEEKPGEEGSLPEVIQLKREEFLEVKNHIAGLEKERDEMKALAQRVQADFDNFRRRNATVMTDCREEGLRSCIKELLPVLDNFDRAMESAKGVQNDWLEGSAAGTAAADGDPGQMRAQGDPRRGDV